MIQTFIGLFSSHCPTASRSSLELWASGTPLSKRFTGCSNPAGVKFADTTCFYSDGRRLPKEPCSENATICERRRGAKPARSSILFSVALGTLERESICLCEARAAALRLS